MGFCCRALSGVFLVALGVTLVLHGTHHCHSSLATSLSRKALGTTPLGGGQLFDPPPTCEHLDCPAYSAVHTESGFEIRSYSPAVWAETEPLLDASFDKATGKGFRSLFQYIQGKNADGVQIPMTAPVLTAIKPSGGPFCSSSFTVKFLVPPQFTPQPPAPLPELKVHVAPMPNRCVAVRRFAGFASDFNVAQEASALADSLGGTPWANISALSGSGREEVYSIAQYNSPFELFNRVNEVWVPFDVEAGSESCSPAVAKKGERLVLSA